MARKVNKETKAFKKKELRKLRNKCRKLWSIAVRARAGNQCEYCGETGRLNAAHIESFELNKNLRFDLRNGVALCPFHHKFGKASFHKSLCFAIVFLSAKRMEDLKYLLKVWNLPVEEVTKESLLLKIDELEDADWKTSL